MSTSSTANAVLQAEWEKFESRFDSGPAKKEFTDFYNWLNKLDSATSENLTFEECIANTEIIKEKAKNLKIEQYTSLLSIDGSYFTNWLEKKTENCGKFRTASSYAYGIYRSKSGITPEYMTAEMRGNKLHKPLNKDDAEKYFHGSLHPIISEIVAFKDLSSGTKPLEINYARKIAYMFNPSVMLPLFKKSVIESIADFFEIDKVDADNYKATETILTAIFTKWSLVEKNFELTLKLGSFLWENFGKPFSFEHKNIILYGAPGTGKTYAVMEGVKRRIRISGDNENEVLHRAQFHPSYSYEDFIEGFKPFSRNGNIELELKSGVFKTLCQKASENLCAARKENKPPSDYYFIADEINRAELSRVLGEVLVCLEESNRLDFNDKGEVIKGIQLKTQYNEIFGVPINLYFIGTMNDIDRSIDSFDLALRRRFVWQRMDCDYDVVADILHDKNQSIINENPAIIEEYINACKDLNKLISDGWDLGKSYEIGHAYFLEIGKISKSSMDKLFTSKISPLLTEYLRSEYNSKDIVEKLKVAKKIFSI